MGVKAGVVLVSKFIKSSSKVFSGYIDYIDRDEATRNENSEKWNGYLDYMGNPVKTSELFTANSDALTMDEKKILKEQFISAQENENIMWQSVFSFDNEWLEEQGLYNKDTHTVDTVKLKELTRISMEKMLKKEGIDESAVWSAAIHYNTGNIHIHVAATEPGRTNRPLMDNGEVRGKWKLSTLNAGKSAMVNGILMQQEENLIINNIMKESILKTKKERNIANDPELRQAFMKVYMNLPENKQYWNYNSTNLGNMNRMNLDELSKLYINKFHKDEFKEFQKAVQTQEEKYKTAYGAGNKQVNEYAKNKEKELYERLGNSILREMREYDKEMKQAEKDGKIKNIRVTNYKMTLENTRNQKDIKVGLMNMNQAMRKINKAFKRDIQSIKNLAEYEKLQNEIQNKSKGYEF